MRQLGSSLAALTRPRLGLAPLGDRSPSSLPVSGAFLLRLSGRAASRARALAVVGAADARAVGVVGVVSAGGLVFHECLPFRVVGVRGVVHRTPGRFGVVDLDHLVGATIRSAVRAEAGQLRAYVRPGRESCQQAEADASEDLSGPPSRDLDQTSGSSSLMQVGYGQLALCRPRARCSSWSAWA